MNLISKKEVDSWVFTRGGFTPGQIRGIRPQQHWLEFYELTPHLIPRKQKLK